MAAEEERDGAPPALQGAMLWRHRITALDGIPDAFPEMSRILDEVRAEVPRRFRDDFIRACNAGLLTAALRTLWDAVLDDLRRKLTEVGVEHLAAFPEIPRVQRADELKALLTARQLLRASFSLGLLDKEAYVRLGHCEDIVAGYLASDDFEGGLDRLTFLDCVKNCVKYCLALHAPLPGFDLPAFLQRLDAEDLRARADELSLSLAPPTPEKVADTALMLMYRRYIAAERNPTADQNVLALFPIAWRRATEGAHRSIGKEFARVRLHGAQDASARAWQLLLLVDGLRFAPDALIATYFMQRSEALLEAHFGWGNFAKELAPAAQLRELGSYVPAEARPIYVRAVLASYLGNPYGISEGAAPHVSAMLDGFDAQLASLAVQLLQSDPDLRSALLSQKPAWRLQALVTRLRPRLSRAQELDWADEVVRVAPADVVKWLTHHRSAA